jgi:hypothetical protein
VKTSFQAVDSVGKPVPALRQSAPAVPPKWDANVMREAPAEESQRSVGPSVGLVEGQVLIYHD